MIFFYHSSSPLLYFYILYITLQRNFLKKKFIFNVFYNFNIITLQNIHEIETNFRNKK